MSKSRDNNYPVNVPFHPLLPTSEMAHQNHGEVYSDHTPMIITVPNPRNVDQPFKTLTWNVLQDDFYNGYSDNEMGRCYGESPEQTEARHRRIASAVVLFIISHEPDFIALQEIGCYAGLSEAEKSEINRGGSPDTHERIYQLILEELKEKDIYKYQTFNHDPRGMLTLYNGNKFTLIGQANNQRSINNGTDSKAALFSFTNDTSLNIKFTPAHHIYSLDTRTHEKSIQEYLTGQDSTSELHRSDVDTLSIIVGDFNGSIASLDNTPHNTTTSVSPACFRTGFASEDNTVKAQVTHGQSCQGAYSLDSGFFRYDQRGAVETLNCYQAESVIADLFSTETLTPEKLPPFSLNVMNNFQRDEVAKYRLCITVDMRHSACINTNETVFELQERLTRETGDELLNVKLVANLNNHKTVAIEVPVNVYRVIKLMSSDDGILSKRYHLDAEFNSVPDNLNGNDRVYIYQPTDPERLINQIIEAYPFAIRFKELMETAEFIEKPEGKRVFDAALSALNDPKVDKKVLLENLDVICNAVKNKDADSIEALVISSKKTQGSSNIKLQVLGVAMMALGALLCTLGALVLATSIVPLPHALPAVAVGSVSIVAGAGLFAGGLALFYRNRSKSDSLSGEMKEYAQSLKNSQ